jgi:hypothetical protein
MGVVIAVLVPDSPDLDSAVSLPNAPYRFGIGDKGGGIELFRCDAKGSLWPPTPELLEPDSYRRSEISRFRAMAESQAR